MKERRGIKENDSEVDKRIEKKTDVEEGQD